MPDDLGAQRRLAARVRARRGVVRRLAEVRGLVGDFHAPHRDLRLRTRDGVGVAASYLPGPREDAPAVLLAHGFAAHRRKPSYAYLADVLSGFAHVLSLDLRGHGASGGASSFGDLERHDVAAGMAWLRDGGCRFVVAVGASMGGTSVLHALADGARADAAVLVSAPAWVGRTDTPPLRQLDRVWRSPWRRGALRAVGGVRLVPPRAWQPFDHPEDLARQVHSPLLVVHGDDDHYFSPDHARALAAAAGGSRRLWHLEDFGHAEDGFVPAFAIALGKAIEHAARTGAFPDFDTVAAPPPQDDAVRDRNGWAPRA